MKNILVAVAIIVMSFVSCNKDVHIEPEQSNPPRVEIPTTRIAVPTPTPTPPIVEVVDTLPNFMLGEFHLDSYKSTESNSSYPDTYISIAKDSIVTDGEWGREVWKVVGVTEVLTGTGYSVELINLEYASPWGGFITYHTHYKKEITVRIGGQLAIYYDADKIYLQMICKR